MVAEIWIAPFSAAEMQRLEVTTLVTGRGIEGDRYEAGRGTWDLFKEPGRNITLISEQGATAALTAAGLPPVEVGRLRRNVVVSGMSAQQLLDARGHVLALGDCSLLVHRDWKPCALNEARNEAGLMDALWDSAGVGCEILQGGTLRVGDRVRVVPGTHQPERCDSRGNITTKSEVYFLRPKLRTAEQVRAQRRGLAEIHEAMRRRDPEGERRVAEAHAAAGIKFWPGPAADRARGSSAAAQCGRALLGLGGATLALAIACAVGWAQGWAAPWAASRRCL